jgi:hypothetical protein
VIPGGSGERGPHLGICQAAGHRGIAAVPQLSGEVASWFFGQQLHESAGIEVDQRHRSAPLIADDLGQRPAHARARPSRRSRALSGRWPADDPVGCQALKGGRGSEAEQPGNRHPAVGNHQFGPAADSFKPLAEMCPKLGNRYVHLSSVHFAQHQFVRRTRCRSFHLGLLARLDHSAAPPGQAMRGAADGQFLGPVAAREEAAADHGMSTVRIMIASSRAPARESAPLGGSQGRLSMPVPVASPECASVPAPGCSSAARPAFPLPPRPGVPGAGPER